MRCLKKITSILKTEFYTFFFLWIQSNRPWYSKYKPHANKNILVLGTRNFEKNRNNTTYLTNQASKTNFCHQNFKAPGTAEDGGEEEKLDLETNNVTFARVSTFIYFRLPFNCQLIEDKEVPFPTRQFSWVWHWWHPNVNLRKLTKNFLYSTLVNTR